MSERLDDQAKRPAKERSPPPARFGPHDDIGAVLLRRLRDHASSRAEREHGLGPWRGYSFGRERCEHPPDSIALAVFFLGVVRPAHRVEIERKHSEHDELEAARGGEIAREP